jgi:hypothetical protein
MSIRPEYYSCSKISGFIYPRSPLGSAYFKVKQLSVLPSAGWHARSIILVVVGDIESTPSFYELTFGNMPYSSYGIKSSYATAYSTEYGITESARTVTPYSGFSKQSWNVSNWLAFLVTLLGLTSPN